MVEPIRSRASGGSGRKKSVPTVGRVVHYVLKSARGIRAATIVHVSGTGQLVNLQFWTDGDNDRNDPEVICDGPTAPTPALVWVRAVLYSDIELPGTWHWAPRGV